MVKKCTRCEKILPATPQFFNKANWIASGLRSDCRSCYSAYKRAWWQKHGPATAGRKRLKEQRAAGMFGLRICCVCEELKPAASEYFTSIDAKLFDTACRGCASLRSERWRQNNRERAVLNGYVQCAKRYATKHQRTPRWLTKEQRGQILAIYATCRSKSHETGIKHHVDHIVPLVGKLVSGLHVPWNLQVVSSSVNAHKHNRFIPGSVNFSSVVEIGETNS